jgi:hypothetical protein
MSIVSINPALYRNMAIDIPNDLVPVSLLLETPQVVVVNPSRPWRTLADVADAAKAAPRTHHLRLGWRRHLDASLRRAVQACDGHGHRPRALSRQRARAWPT